MENYKPTRTLTEMFAEVRENFEKDNGRLLTEEEAVLYTEEIKRNVQARKDKQEDDDIKRIEEILNSESFDEETLVKLTGAFEQKEKIEYIYSALTKQYAELDIVKICENNDKDKIIDFLNRLMKSELEDKKRDRYAVSIITQAELEEFRILAEETDKISKEELSKTAPVLTTRSYMEMCRIVYDATSEWKYPDDISTAYLYCEARLSSFGSEYKEGIFGVDWDSPEEFAYGFMTSYHHEELEFGGLKMYIHDESACLGRNLYEKPDTYSRWTGLICCDASVIRSIRMFLALRKAGYPVYFYEYEVAYLKAKEYCAKYYQ